MGLAHFILSINFERSSLIFELFGAFIFGAFNDGGAFNFGAFNDGGAFNLGAFNDGGAFSFGAFNDGGAFKLGGLIFKFGACIPIFGGAKLELFCGWFKFELIDGGNKFEFRFCGGFNCWGAWILFWFGIPTVFIGKFWLYTFWLDTFWLLLIDPSAKLKYKLPNYNYTNYYFDLIIG